MHAGTVRVNKGSHSCLTGTIHVIHIWNEPCISAFTLQLHSGHYSFTIPHDGSSINIPKWFMCTICLPVQGTNQAKCSHLVSYVNNDITTTMPQLFDMYTHLRKGHNLNKLYSAKKIHIFETINSHNKIQHTITTAKLL